MMGPSSLSPWVNWLIYRTEEAQNRGHPYSAMWMNWGRWEDMGHRGSSPTSEPEEPSLCLGRGWLLAIFPHSAEIGFPLEIVSLDHSCKVLSLSTQAVCSNPSHCSCSFGILGGRAQNIVAKCTGYGVRQT